MASRLTTYTGTLVKHCGKKVTDFGYCDCPDCASIPEEYTRMLRFFVLLEDGTRLYHVSPRSLTHVEYVKLED